MPDFARRTLALNAFYALQLLFVKGYGNWLGPCRIGEFVASQTEPRLRLERLNCYAGIQKMTAESRPVAGELPARLAEAGSMQKAFDLIRAYPTVGDFLGYQYVTDVNSSRVTGFTEMEFVVPGPGAIDGIRKCFSDTGCLNHAEVIRFMADRQEIEFERLGIRVQDLWGRRLQLIDCQNLFCEVDKYSPVLPLAA